MSEAAQLHGCVCPVPAFVSRCGLGLLVVGGNTFTRPAIKAQDMQAVEAHSVMALI